MGWQVTEVLLSIETIISIDKKIAKGSEKYKSKVIDIGDEFIVIDYPTHIETGRIAFFIDGAQIHVTFTNSMKSSYAFQAKVIGRVNKGVPLLKLSYPGDDQLIKIQRREFVRVETPIDVAIEKDGQFSQCVAEDISAGGIAINLPVQKEFKEGDSLGITITLPFISKDIKYIKADMTIIRIWEKDGRKIASLQFEEVPQDDRQNIVRFCFEHQLRMRKKEQ
ncbi:flagellar brake protein [Sporosarcina limicola]|uniref:C-di-GMP-binding flagellar brake protein YcgR n=1 Tax=Sporosarcina limicola TaxID=34101 RepID=A0A927MHR7_9BACL|nr:flagellar brake domain-containing protein [Sporosarcina limicola]MBE1554098.1 c-di-GMP-binding flagellar brake protein YcgR [Sporosarcina limicola]